MNYMKKEFVENHNLKELTPDECVAITGGGDIVNYLRCVSQTLTSGGGGIRTLALGASLFGFARLLGVAVGCANL
jgi:hypothetical protein